MIHICAPRAPIRCHALTTLRASRRRMAQHDNISIKLNMSKEQQYPQLRRAPRELPESDQRVLS
jgi:hypothetical protein